MPYRCGKCRLETGDPTTVVQHHLRHHINDEVSFIEIIYRGGNIYGKRRSFMVRGKDCESDTVLEVDTAAIPWKLVTSEVSKAHTKTGAGL